LDNPTQLGIDADQSKPGEVGKRWIINLWCEKNAGVV